MPEFWGGEHDKACRLPAGESADKRAVGVEHFGEAAEFPAFQELHIADVGAIYAQAEPGGQDDAQGRHDAQDLLIAIERPHDEYRQEHVRPVFELQVLNQRALVLLGAGELGAFELPGAVDGFHLAGAYLRLSESFSGSEGEDNASGDELRQS